MESNAAIFFSYAWGDDMEQGERKALTFNENYNRLAKELYNAYLEMVEFNKNLLWVQNQLSGD